MKEDFTQTQAEREPDWKWVSKKQFATSNKVLWNLNPSGPLTQQIWHADIDNGVQDTPNIKLTWMLL